MNNQSLFFVTLPKSGTVYTWNAISEVTGLAIPSFHELSGWSDYTVGKEFVCEDIYACGDYNTQLLRPKQMKKYLHDYCFGAHMQASHHNVKVLEECELTRIVVLLRDPRDALVSWVHHLRKLGESSRNYHSKIYHIPREYFGWSLEKQFEYQVRTFLPVVSNWVEGWLDYYASSDRKLDVLFVLYDELKRTPAEYIKKIIDFAQVKRADYSKMPQAQPGKMHFRKGEHGQWKVDFSDDDKRLSDALMQHRIQDGFDCAARSHVGVKMSEILLGQGKSLAAAEAVLSAIKQFPNSQYCYELFFKAIKATGVNTQLVQANVQKVLHQLALEDYFVYREELVSECEQLLETARAPVVSHEHASVSV